MPRSSEAHEQARLPACSSSRARLIAGNAGILVAEVIYVKEGDDRTFVIVDAAMNDLIRPDPLRRPSPHRPGAADARAATIVCDVVGPVCETRRFPRQAAATAAVRSQATSWRSIRPAPMARCRPAPTIRACSCPKSWSTATDFAIVRPRQTYEELIGLDRLPDWLG